jgi:ribokinase
VGHVNWDVTLQVDALPAVDGEARVHDRSESGGGSAANCASTLATLGVETGVLGSVGADPQGRQARRELVDAGVDVTGLVETDVGTATKYLAVDADGRVMVFGDDRGNEAFTLADLPDGLGAVDHVHVTGQRAGRAVAVAGAARDHGASVSVDPGRRAGQRAFDPALALADCVFLTTAEADAVGLDLADPDDRGDWPAPEGRTAADERVVVLKDGADGARLRSPAGVVTHPGFAVDPVDTAGAGDAFAAGYLATTVTDWTPLGDEATTPAPGRRRALTVAAACGAITTRRTGARVQLSRGDVERFLRERP